MFFLRLLTLCLVLANSMAVFAAEADDVKAEADDIKIDDPLKAIFDELYVVGLRIRSTPASKSYAGNVSDDEKRLYTLYGQLKETENDYVQKADNVLGVFGVNILDIENRIGDPNLKRAVKQVNTVRPAALSPSLSGKQKEYQESLGLNKFKAALDYYAKDQANKNSLRNLVDAYNNLTAFESELAEKALISKSIAPSFLETVNVSLNEPVSSSLDTKHKAATQIKQKASYGETVNMNTFKAALDYYAKDKKNENSRRNLAIAYKKVSIQERSQARSLLKSKNIDLKLLD